MLQEICERDELRSTYRPIKVRYIVFRACLFYSMVTYETKDEKPNLAFQTEEEAKGDVADHTVWYSVHRKMMEELAFEKGKELVKQGKVC